MLKSLPRFGAEAPARQTGLSGSGIPNSARCIFFCELLESSIQFRANAAPLPIDKAGSGMVNLGYAVTRNTWGTEKASLARSAGDGRAWTDAALVRAASIGRSMRMEGTGGSGRGSLGEGNCSSMHIEMYLRVE